MLNTSSKYFVSTESPEAVHESEEEMGNSEQLPIC